MKIKHLSIVCGVLLARYDISHAQPANQTLSNLISPTAINESLLPGLDNRINLGSGGRGGFSWRNLYLGNAIFLDGDITIHAPGKGNFFSGQHAGNSTLSNINNTGIGQFSLFNLTSGRSNTAHGFSTLYSNTVGTQNTASGDEALYLNTSGHNNTANGFAGLFYNITGENNTAIGSRAIYYNADGSNNTAVGFAALHNNTAGADNTALGTAALATNTAGFNNIAVGFYADVSSDNLFNATAIGFFAKVDASNKVRIGNTSVTSIGGQVSWSTFSDGRYKKDIKENIAGLAFINNLRPISYTVNVQGLNEYYNKGRKQISDGEAFNAKVDIANAEIKKGEEAGRIIYNGFVAQEVEETAKKLNFEFSGVDKPQNKDGLYGLRYDNFVVPLVKAVQELSKMNDEKDAKINALQNQNDDFKKRIERLETMMKTGQSSINLADASLAQNVPNPFTGTTAISYSLPSKFATAQIIISDKSGKQLKQLNISGRNGIVNIDAALLTSGAYNYSLIVDGRIISSKQMIVGK